MKSGGGNPCFRKDSKILWAPPEREGNLAFARTANFFSEGNGAYTDGFDRDSCWCRF